MSQNQNFPCTIEDFIYLAMHSSELDKIGIFFKYESKLVVLLLIKFSIDSFSYSLSKCSIWPFFSKSVLLPPFRIIPSTSILLWEYLFFEIRSGISFIFLPPIIGMLTILTSSFFFLLLSSRSQFYCILFLAS